MSGRRNRIRQVLPSDGRDDSSRVTRHAMDCGSERLLPEWRDEQLVRPRSRWAMASYVIWLPVSGLLVVGIELLARTI
jgi:hypothetical protein